MGTSTQTLGTLTAGETVQPTGFQIQLGTGFTDLQQVNLNFVLTYGTGQQQTISQSFYVVPATLPGDLYGTYAPTESVLQWDPGLQSERNISGHLPNTWA